MARSDRCVICDYSESKGSGYAGVNPGKAGRVRRYGNAHLCEICHQAIQDALYSRPDEDEVEHVIEET